MPHRNRRLMDEGAFDLSHIQPEHRPPRRGN
jgi:hypothetical protein